MKYYGFIGILFLLLSFSCSVKKLTRQYLANDDVCFCGLDSILLEGEEKFDVNKLDFDNVPVSETDTLINNKDTLETWWHNASKSFTIKTLDKVNNIETVSDYYPNSLLDYKRSYLLYNNGFLRIGYSVGLNEKGKYLWKSTNNYVVESVEIDTVHIVAEKYPICWKEALNIVEAKIGKYELLGLNRSFYSGPNYKGMDKYWAIEIKKKRRKPRLYYVDATTGRIERDIIIVTLGTDDML